MFYQLSYDNDSLYTFQELGEKKAARQGTSGERQVTLDERAENLEKLAMRQSKKDAGIDSDSSD